MRQGLSEPKSEHELTTDAYTDTDELEDEDWDDENEDIGHHDDYDGINNTPTEPSIATMNTPTPASAPENRPTEPTTVETVEEEEPVANAPCAESTEPVIEMFEQTTGKEERSTIHDQTAKKEEQDDKPARKKGLRPKKSADYKYHFGFMQTDSTTGATEQLPAGTTLNDIQQVFGKAFATALTTAPIPETDDGSPTAPKMQSLRKVIFGLVFTQMSAQKGIKKHGQVAWDALKKEFEQLKDMDVFEPLDAFMLTEEQKGEALRALSVIKEKRDGRIKGRTVADGSTQRGKYSKEDTGSPTISNDALFLTILVDAYENRDVATADITGAYLHAFMRDFVCLRVTGWAVELLCEVNPNYNKYMVFEGKTKVLYVRCNKALYGCVMSGLLWYKLFTTTLAGIGFEINPYDFCVANAKIEGSQCTVGWFVDDTKISHVKAQVVTDIIGHMESKFGKMTVTRGWEHKFLGMNITYHGDGTASIHMPTYIQEAIDDSGLNIAKDAPTPCANSLLTINPKSPLLNKKRSEMFHSVVAKLIYVGTRARTDILLTLAFLCRRVTKPTKQDERKLRRLLEYLRGTKNMSLRLGADSLNKFMTWVDASFAIHSDMRSHTGGVISFGHGGIICKSKKQNINTKSSTEAELIGASDYLPHSVRANVYGSPRLPDHTIRLLSRQRKRHQDGAQC